VTKNLSQLDALIGEWTTSSKTYPEGRGLTTVTLAEGGKFVRIEATIEDERFPQSTQIVGCDETGDECTALYYDSRGVYRIYLTTVRDREWKMWREAPGFSQRYTGKISEDGKTIAGQWEFSEDGHHWRVDFDLAYEKVG
jgi:hypothetical protein